MRKSSVVVDILGTQYRVFLHDGSDPKLEEADGYCDSTSKKIVIRGEIPKTVNTVSNLSVYQQKVLRHEIIHAFLYESGLDNNSWADEEVVDWFALQFEKIRTAIAMASSIWEDECVEKGDTEV